MKPCLWSVLLVNGGFSYSKVHELGLLKQLRQTPSNRHPDKPCNFPSIAECTLEIGCTYGAAPKNPLIPPGALRSTNFQQISRCQKCRGSRLGRWGKGWTIETLVKMGFVGEILSNTLHEDLECLPKLYMWSCRIHVWLHRTGWNVWKSQLRIYGNATSLSPKRRAVQLIVEPRRKQVWAAADHREKPFEGFKTHGNRRC